MEVADHHSTRTVGTSHVKLHLARGARRSPRSERKDLGVLLVDPRPLTRDSISRHIASCARDIRVFGVTTAKEANLVADGETIDVALINLGAETVHSAGAAAAIASLQATLPDVPIAVLAEDDAIDRVTDGLRLGLRGYIPTDIDVDVMLAALRLIATGGTFIPASAVTKVRDEPAASARPAEDAASPLDGFTPRQTAVLAGLRQGKPNKIIAYELQMCESTVKVHVRNILKRLGAANRTQAAYLLQNRGRRPIRAAEERRTSVLPSPVTD